MALACSTSETLAQERQEAKSLSELSSSAELPAAGPKAAQRTRGVAAQGPSPGPTALRPENSPPRSAFHCVAVHFT